MPWPDNVWTWFDVTKLWQKLLSRSFLIMPVPILSQSDSTSDIYNYGKKWLSYKYINLNVYYVLYIWTPTLIATIERLFFSTLLSSTFKITLIMNLVRTHSDAKLITWFATAAAFVFHKICYLIKKKIFGQTSSFFYKFNCGNVKKNWIL